MGVARTFLSIEAAKSAIRKLFLALPAEREDGCEGLVRDALQAATGVEFRLKTTGFQGAVDGVAVKEGARLVMESKRYAQLNGLRRELFATLGNCAVAEPKPDLLVIAASVSIDMDLREEIAKFQLQNDFDVAFVDWAGKFPTLAVLLAIDRTVFSDFFARLGKTKESKRALNAVSRLRSAPGFEDARIKLLDALLPESCAFETFRRDSIKWHKRAMVEPRVAMQLYGQALWPVRCDGETRVVPRPRWISELHEQASVLIPWRNTENNSTFTRRSPVVVFGEEGVGKSWLVAQWWLSHRMESPFVFLPSRLFRGGEVDAVSILMEAMAALIDPRRMTAPHAKERWIRRFRRERPKGDTTNDLLILVDGVNEAPGANWRKILEDLWHQAVRLNADLIVTSRPSFWREHPDLHRIDWPDPAELPLTSFDDGELAVALAIHGRRVSDIPPRIAERIRNPRVFSLAMRLYETLPRTSDLGIDKLLYSYWDQRRREREDLEGLDPDGKGWLQGLANHAREIYHRYREAVARQSGNISADGVSFSFDDLRDRFPAFFRRFGIMDGPKFELLLGDIRDGLFFRDVPSVTNARYIFRSDALKLALGLFLLEEVQRIESSCQTDCILDELREHLDSLLQPVMDFDQTADQLLAAITVACVNKAASKLVRVVLLERFIRLRNRPEELKSEYVALAADSPNSFSELIDILVPITEPALIDKWLMEALRYAYSRSLLTRECAQWIVSPPPKLAAVFPSYTLVPYELHAYRFEVVAAQIIFGFSLAPMAQAFLDWACLAAHKLCDAEMSRENIDAFLAPAPHEGDPEDGLTSPLGRSPTTKVIRFNDHDPEDLEAAVKRIASSLPLRSESCAYAGLGFGLLLAIMASPQALSHDEVVLRSNIETLDPLDKHEAPLWHSAVDPDADEVPLLATLRQRADQPEDRVADPYSPRGEEMLALAARCDRRTYVHSIESILFALVDEKGGQSDCFSDPYAALAFLAEACPSVFSANRRVASVAVHKKLCAFASAGAIEYIKSKAGKSGTNLMRLIDYILEVTMASQSADAFVELLLNVPWEVCPMDHWPVRPYRWRPRLTKKMLAEVVEEAVRRLESDDEGEKVGGTNLLGAAALHPAESLSPTLVDHLSTIFFDEDRGEHARRAAIQIAMKAGDYAVAERIWRSGWRADRERERQVALEVSFLMCTALAGKFPLREWVAAVLPAALPNAVEGVFAGEMAELLQHLKIAIEKGIQLSECAAAAPSESGYEEKRHFYNLCEISPGGARRLLISNAEWAGAAIKLLAQELRTSPRNSLLETFATALIGGGGSVVDGEADYIILLLRSRLSGKRRPGMKMLRAALAVATRNPEVRDRILNWLVLSSMDDGALSRLCKAAESLGDATVELFARYVTSLMASGRTVRMAYGYMLCGMFSHVAPTLQRHLWEISEPRGYLGRIALEAREISRRSSMAEQWITRRLERGDIAAEHLALCTPSKPSAPLHVMRRLANGENISSKDMVFINRIIEKTEGGETDSLFHLPHPPNWLIEARINSISA